MPASSPVNATKTNVCCTETPFRLKNKLGRSAAPLQLSTMPSPAETWSKCAPTRMTSSVCPRSVQIKFGGAFFLTICSEINSPVQPLCAKSFFRASFPFVVLGLARNTVESKFDRGTINDAVASLCVHILHVNDAPKRQHRSYDILHHTDMPGAFRPSIPCSAPV